MQVHITRKLHDNFVIFVLLNCFIGRLPSPSLLLLLLLFISPSVFISCFCHFFLTCYIFHTFVLSSFPFSSSYFCHSLNFLCLFLAHICFNFAPFLPNHLQLINRILWESSFVKFFSIIFFFVRNSFTFEFTVFSVCHFSPHIFPCSLLWFLFSLTYLVVSFFVFIIFLWRTYFEGDNDFVGFKFILLILLLYLISFFQTSFILSLFKFSPLYFLSFLFPFFDLLVLIPAFLSFPTLPDYLILFLFFYSLFLYCFPSLIHSPNSFFNNWLVCLLFLV